MAHCLTLNKSNCKNCYKCIRHCPVKSIRFTGGQAQIIANECVLCGQCFVVCPQDAKEIVSEVEQVKLMLMADEPVFVSLAPSFIANWDGCGIEAMRDALKKLGFAEVEETAIGATMVKNDFDRKVDEEASSIIISSCCHSVNLLVQRYFPECIPYLAETLSPMQVHCADIKRRHPSARTVFIGPCIAKKDEAQRYGGIVDAALTFEELSRWFAEEGIEVEHKVDRNNESRTRFFPTAGGVLKTMKKDNPNYDYFAIDGAQNCIAALEDIRDGNIDHCFIEMNMCPGACINGPVMEKYHYSLVRDYLQIARYAGERDFPVEQPDAAAIHKNFEVMAGVREMPSEMTIREILKAMGKEKPEDELNCGTCGYDTCRDKAIAVYQGKAQAEMCLPYLMNKAESFSNTVVYNSPIGMVTTNERYEIQRVNPAAAKMLNIKNVRDVMGEQIVTILSPKPFMDAVKVKHSVFYTDFFAEYQKYLEMNVVHDADSGQIICLLEDVTDAAEARKKKSVIDMQTIQTADEVVEKQMRIVQEIASLLGETAAETKIALTNLKAAIETDEGGLAADDSAVGAAAADSKGGAASADGLPDYMGSVGGGLAEPKADFSEEEFDPEKYVAELLAQEQNK